MFSYKKVFLSSLTLLCCFAIPTTTFATVNAEIFKTANNIEIILLQDKTTDLVAVNLGFKGAGAIADLPSKAGLGSTMMELIFRSNADGMDRHAKAKKIRELGILSDINFAVTDDDIKIAFKTPIENFKLSLDMLSTILFKAELNNAELSKIKAFGTSNSQLARSDEDTFAWAALRASIFNGHPYANVASGNEQGIQSLNLTDIEQAFQQRLAHDNLIVAVVGNIDKKTLSKYIDAIFAKLPAKATLPVIATAVPKLDNQVKTIFKDSPQSSAVFVEQSLPYTDKDFYPFLLLNRILGGEPFTSRLWLELREKRGLVYGISTTAHTETKLANVMLGQFKCNNQDANKVIAIIKEEFIKLKNNGITQEEFAAAKTGIIGQYALHFISPDQTSAYLLGNRLLGFDMQRINDRNQKIKAITFEDVNRVAKQHLHPEQLSFVVIGDPK